MPRIAKHMIIENKELMSEWDYEKNVSFGYHPESMGKNSTAKVWWKCQYGHSWNAIIRNRNSGRGCPDCNKMMKTSFPEQAVYHYVKKVFPDAVSGYKDIFTNGMELDIYIPSIKLGIEYDGEAWHKSNQHAREVKKYKMCTQSGVKLLRLREKISDGDELTADYLLSIDNIRDRQKLEHLIHVLLDRIDPESNFWTRKIASHYYSSVDVNIERDENEIRTYMKSMRDGSLKDNYPDIAAEWDSTKNGTLSPDMFSAHSAVNVWWICEKGHGWEAGIASRTRGSGCPYCSGQRVLKGFNDLETLYPSISREWDYEVNGELKPSMFIGGSGRKVGWVCSHGHKWMASIHNRTKNNRGCPYCTHEKPIAGENDLATLQPELVKEWHPTFNGELKPNQFMPYSNKRVWWLCPKCGYEYQTYISNRVKGTGCKNCSNQILHSGVNDLATLYPELVAEWDYEENGDVFPGEVFPKSNKKYAWKDSLGHKWIATPNARTAGSGCPYCSGNKVLEGFNDLPTTHPDIAKEWHPYKNGDLLPTMISKGYGKKVWWLCSKCETEYEAYVGNRIKGFGCKNCRRS